ncbi:MAG: hypothetical protein H0V93_13160 [Euzebyales bacterium]|nr:hypothetical protein [Euzebyales bacterium]
MPNDVPRLGSWSRARDLIGLVARVADGEVTLFHPGERRQLTVPAVEAEPVPAGAVTVTVSVELPVPHGLGEAELRRWVSSLTDDAVRERAYAALADADLDVGATLPGSELTVRSSADSGAVCLCGTRTPAPPGEAVPCPTCGREAVGPPARPGDPPGG